MLLLLLKRGAYFQEDRVSGVARGTELVGPVVHVPSFDHTH